MKEIMCDICGSLYEIEKENECNVCCDCIQHYNNKALQQDKEYLQLVNEGV